MTKSRRADILPLPTSAEIASRANELRAILSLDDSADEIEIRSELKSLRAETPAAGKDRNCGADRSTDTVSGEIGESRPRVATTV